MASQIPADNPEKYQRWLEDLRESLDRDLEEIKQKGMLEVEHGNRNYTQTAPLNGLFIEWMYELDLDREVFLGESPTPSSPSNG